MEKQLLTTREVAEMMGISQKEVRRLRESGYLKAARGFRCPYKFFLNKVKEYMAEFQKV
jgi:excisionase family DNA binding protein